MSRTLRPLACLCALSCAFLFSAPARATWSIILIDAQTNEMAVGAATCLANFDLRKWLPVVRVNVGAACAQAAVDNFAGNRKKIWDQLALGTAPVDILAILQAGDPSHQSRQYGIGDTLGRIVTFTGSNTSAYANGVTGSFGTVAYTIQGNILTGAPVVEQAELAVLNTTGDLPERLMAGMEAARAMGGDGRCSCSTTQPTSCGSPPPSFTKAAHCGFLIVSRVGDADGVCNSSLGCANGNYYLTINIAGQTASDPDPVFQMRTQFDAWRASLVGRPDALHSTVAFLPPALPANGAVSTMTIMLKDWQGTQLGSGASAVSVALESGSPGVTTIGSVINHGDGTYTVPITATTVLGTDSYRIVANDGIRPVTLMPSPGLTVVRPADLTSDGVVNGDDIGRFVAAATGIDADPLHRAATDLNANSVYGDDADTFVAMLLSP